MNMDLFPGRKEALLLKTEIPAFDDLLCGGIYRGEIIEIFGEFRTGKTQFCHFLATKHIVDALAHASPQHMIFVDTEATFRPERILDFARGFQIPTDEVLRYILHLRVTSFSDLTLVVSTLSQEVTRRGISLVVIDSLTHFFREYLQEGGPPVTSRNQFIELMNQLKVLSEEHSCTIIFSNQVTSANNQAFPPFRPVADTILQHIVKERLFFEDQGTTEGLRRLSVIHSRFRPPGSRNFEIQEEKFVAV